VLELTLVLGLIEMTQRGRDQAVVADRPFLVAADPDSVSGPAGTGVRFSECPVVYTDDAIFAGPGLPTIEGRAALLAAAKQTTISSMQIVADSDHRGRRLAATLGRASWVSRPRNSGAPTRRRRFLMVWRKEPDWRWRIARELLNEDL